MASTETPPRSKAAKEHSGLREVTLDLTWQPRGEDVCRYCSKPGSSEEKLVAPCQCTDDRKYVHHRCLRRQLEVDCRVYCEFCGDVFSWQATRLRCGSLWKVLAAFWSALWPQLKRTTLLRPPAWSPERVPNPLSKHSHHVVLTAAMTLLVFSVCFQRDDSYLPSVAECRRVAVPSVFLATLAMIILLTNRTSAHDQGFAFKLIGMFFSIHFALGCSRLFPVLDETFYSVMTPPIDALPIGVRWVWTLTTGVAFLLFWLLLGLWVLANVPMAICCALICLRDAIIDEFADCKVLDSSRPA